MNNIPHDRKPHPHQHVILAWAEGKTIQVLSHNKQGWVDCLENTAPLFSKHEEYRIKPESNPPYSLYAQVYAGDAGVQISFLTRNRLCLDNVQFTFDGNTNQLIDVYLIPPEDQYDINH